MTRSCRSAPGDSDAGCAFLNGCALRGLGTAITRLGPGIAVSGGRFLLPYEAATRRHQIAYGAEPASPELLSISGELPTTTAAFRRRRRIADRRAEETRS